MPARLFFREQILAGFGATATGFGANTTVLHLRAVLFAFGATALARFDAGAKLGPGELKIGAGEARDDAGGHQTNIRAICAMADARDHGGDIFFPEAGIGAGVTRFGAGITSRDALDIDRVVR